MAPRDASDAPHRYTQPAREIGFAMPRAQTEKQFVIFTSAQRMTAIGAHHRDVRGRERDIRNVERRADLASFENVPEVLEETVADIDRSGSRSDRGQALSGDDAIRRLKESIEQESARVAGRFKFAGEQTPSEGGVANRAGDEDFVAGA